jgi:hypothetical protein
MKINLNKLVIIVAAAAPFVITHASLWAGEKIDTSYDRGDFTHPLIIDNEYWPLIPGTTFIYAAEGEDECELNIFRVTDGVKVIKGLPGNDLDTVVVHDQAWTDENCDGVINGDDSLAEITDDWHAQDDDGNIWYLGEDSNECDENGCNDPAGSWEAGVDGAVPGIIMLADPHQGDQYFQEFYEDEAEDQAKVLRLKVWVSLHRDDALDPKDFHDCVKTKEWTRLSHGAVEHKYYCPDVGLVAVDELMGKTLRFELLEIVPPPAP